MPFILSCDGISRIADGKERVRRIYYVDLLAQTYCEDDCGVVEYIPRQTSELVSFSTPPRGEDEVINTIYRDTTFYFRSKEWVSKESYSFAYLRRLNIRGKCDVAPLKLKPVLKALSGAKRTDR